MARHTEQAVAQVAHADPDEGLELLEEAAEGMTMQQQVLDGVEIVAGEGEGAVRRAVEALGSACGAAKLDGLGLGNTRVITMTVVEVRAIIGY